jgi:hypothetical protein
VSPTPAQPPFGVDYLKRRAKGLNPLFTQKCRGAGPGSLGRGTEHGGHVIVDVLVACKGTKERRVRSLEKATQTGDETCHVRLPSGMLTRRSQIVCAVLHKTVLAPGVD